jgi:hypothetical protein
MPNVRHPDNALDDFAVTYDASNLVKWRPSEYCDQTFIVTIPIGVGGHEVELNIRFYPDHYAMSARFPQWVSDGRVNSITACLTDVLDQCIYY